MLVTRAKELVRLTHHKMAFADGMHHTMVLVYRVNKWLQKKGLQHLVIRLKKSCIFLTILSLFLDYDHSMTLLAIY